MCSRYSITVPSSVVLGHRMPPGKPKMLNFLFVSLSVTLLDYKVCENDFTYKALKLRSDFDIFG